MALRKLVTIGVYGWSEEDFFSRLSACGVDTFCDLRRRRGVRGATYAFANRSRLESRLTALGIRYVHLLELAPTPETRALQRVDDRAQDVGKRERTALSDRFVEAYRAQCLAGLQPGWFLDAIGSGASVAALFCVERDPAACHRSLAGIKLSADLGVSVEDLTP